MKTIKDVTNKYSSQIDLLDLELLIASTIQKPREFVLAHPEYKIPVARSPKLEAWIKRRLKHEPIAYILGEKEFFKLNFKVNRHTLIPRPETELLVEETLNLLRNKLRNMTVIDVGTGSGNIIISIANELKKVKLRIANYKLLATDISEKALAIARRNAKLHKVDRKIKFLKGDLLYPVISNLQLATRKRIVIVANLPYLSKNIHTSVSQDIKKYEPKSALLSGNKGLSHYERLLKQIKTLKNQYCMLHVSCFMEISPEQKRRLQKILKSVLPDAKIAFYKDLSGRWRMCRLSL